MSIGGGGYLNKRKISDRLEKFDKYKNQKRIAVASVIGLFLLTGVVHLYKTFAFYEEKKTFNVIRGKVPDFRIKYTIYINDVVSSSIPSKDQGGVFNGYSCNKTGVTIQWDSTNWKPIASGPKGVGISCTLKFKMLWTTPVNIGDYVAYTPSKTSYTISSADTGYTSNQTINPSELNLWRVIKKNSDGTVEVVSEYTSSNYVYFYGETGYEKLVGTLNTIAKQYETSGKTVGSRHMGYSGQTATVDIYGTASPPWSGDTSSTNSPNGSAREKGGGGDYGYFTDYRLVIDAIGRYSAKAVGYESSDYPYYWLASRYWGDQTKYGWLWAVRMVYNNELRQKIAVYGNYFGPWTWNFYNVCGTIRPIVKLSTSLSAEKKNHGGRDVWVLK